MIRSLALFAFLVAACNQNAAPGTALPGMTGMPGMTAGMPMTAAMPALPGTVAMPMPATAGVAAEPTSADLPVPEDFEEEAATAVQPANFHAELDRIAAEVEATPSP